MKMYALKLMYLGGLAAITSYTTVPPPRIAVVAELMERHLSGGMRSLDANGVPLADEAGEAYFLDRYERKDSANITWRLRRYVRQTGRLVLEQFSFGDEMRLEGASREWYETGQLREELTYNNNVISGVLRTYHPNGKLRRVQYFPAPAGVSQCFDSEGQLFAACLPYHTFAQRPGLAELTPVERYIQKNHSRYLPRNYRAKESLAVFYAFRVSPEGQVRDARILTASPQWSSSAVPAELAAAILHTIDALPAFVPATLDGYPTSDVVEGVVFAGPASR